MTEFTELFNVLAHELRTPIAAIMGYQELLAEGIYGNVDERGHEPLERIGFSARQLLHLIDGMQQITLGEGKSIPPDLEDVDPANMLRDCLHNAEADAIGRSVKLEAELPEKLPSVHANEELVCRSIDLALAAAIKTSHGATLHIHADAVDQSVKVFIENTGLDPERDSPDNLDGSAKLTGAGLRLAIVRQIIKKLSGDVVLTPTPAGCTLTLEIPTS